MMKKTVPPNRRTGRMIAKNLIVLLVLVTVTFVSMWAWFTDGAKADADGINVQCATAEGIEIAVVPHGEKVADVTKLTYKDTIELRKSEEGEPASILDTLSLTEITSNGITFYRPALKQTDGIASPVITDTEGNRVTWNEAVQQVHYLSFDLYIRSKASQTVRLENSSSFVPHSTYLTGSPATNKSTYGDYSRDCIVGAARFSVVDKSNARKVLWIPHPELKLETTANEGGGHTFTMLTGLTSGDSYNHQYYGVNSSKQPNDNPTVVVQNVDPAKGVTASTKASNGSYVLGKNVALTELEEKKSDNYYYGLVTCNMWIEGEDPEAKLALVGGEFTMKLNFTGTAS